MGVRGEIFSKRVMLPNRTYFFNVKENRMGDLYLNIVESKNRESGGFERQSVILFSDDLQEFLKGFDESLRVMEKAVREKKQSGGERKPKKEFQGRDEKDGKPKQRRDFNNDRNQRHGFSGGRDKNPKQRSGFRNENGQKPRKNFGSDKREQGSRGGKNDYAKKNRRVVVKKYEK